MGKAVIQQQIQDGKTSLRLLLIVLAIVLFALPVAAVAKLILATDDELDDVVAQSLLEFTTVRRTTTSGWGNITHDVAILKANAQIKIDNMRVDQVLLGYYNGGWDIEIGNSTGIVWGGRGDSDNDGNADDGPVRPVYFKGLRLEVAYTTAGHFSFLRIGTDDFSGVLDVKRIGSNTAGAIIRQSMDGRIRAITDVTTGDVDVNARRTTQASLSGHTVGMSNVWQLYFNAGTGEFNRGTTDFYISMSDYIYPDGSGTYRNSVAINPRNLVHYNGTAAYAHHLPGYGWWMHFNQISAEAYPW
jgi:hypothetical protein